jgi:hypothetical protein
MLPSRCSKNHTNFPENLENLGRRCMWKLLTDGEIEVAPVVRQIRQDRLTVRPPGGHSKPAVVTAERRRSVHVDGGGRQSARDRWMHCYEPKMSLKSLRWFGSSLYKQCSNAAPRESSFGRPSRRIGSDRLRRLGRSGIGQRKGSTAARGARVRSPARRSKASRATVHKPPGCCRWIYKESYEYLSPLPETCPKSGHLRSAS